MKGALLTLSVVVLLLTIRGLASGSPSDCEQIKNVDQRNYCRAVSQQKKTWCEFIKNNDLRHRCRAEI